MENVSAALRTQRIAAGMTQRQLADILGITAAFLNDIEHGRRVLGQKYIELLPEPIRGPVADAMVAVKEAEIDDIRRAGQV